MNRIKTLFFSFSFSFSLFLLPFFLSIFFLPCCAQEKIQLKDRLNRAQTGDFLIIDYSRTLLALVVSSQNQRTISIEEIMIPSSLFPKGRHSYRSWLEERAPRATCWNHYEIDKTTAKMLSAYSYTKRTALDVSSSKSFLTNLLYLELEKIPEEQRKRIRKKNPFGEQPLWQPPLIMDGQRYDHVSFDAYVGQWPLDSSELSGKLVQVYLPQEQEGFPSHFPYWLQVTNNISSTKLRVIDSGRGLHF